jgi:hypothetical protein
MNVKPITNHCEMTVKTVLDIPIKYSATDNPVFHQITVNLNYEPFLIIDETPFGTSGQYVYTYTTSHRVYKFKLTNRGDGVITRKEQRRQSKDYVCSLLNTPEGRERYNKVRDNLKMNNPKCKVVRLGRGPHMSTSERGTVRMDKATHFDVYVRS